MLFSRRCSFHVGVSEIHLLLSLFGESFDESSASPIACRDQKNESKPAIITDRKMNRGLTKGFHVTVQY